MTMVRLTTTRKPGQRDPHVFAPQPGVDYHALADTHWADAQLMAHDIRRLTRIEGKGRAAVAAAAAARDATLQRQREGKLDRVRLKLDVLRRACWFHVCGVYACLQHIDAVPWLRRNTDASTEPLAPATVWRWLLPEEEPGPWPIPDESRATEAETWNLPALRALLQGRKRR